MYMLLSSLGYSVTVAVTDISRGICFRCHAWIRVGGGGG